MDGGQIKPNMMGTALDNPRSPPRPITLTSPDVLGRSREPQYCSCVLLGTLGTRGGRQYDGLWKFRYQDYPQDLVYWPHIPGATILLLRVTGDPGNSQGSPGIWGGWAWMGRRPKSTWWVLMPRLIPKPIILTFSDVPGPTIMGPKPILASCEVPGIPAGGPWRYMGVLGISREILGIPQNPCNGLWLKVDIVDLIAQTTSNPIVSTLTQAAYPRCEWALAQNR